MSVSETIHLFFELIRSVANRKRYSLCRVIVNDFRISFVFLYKCSYFYRIYQSFPAFVFIPEVPGIFHNGASHETSMPVIVHTFFSAIILGFLVTLFDFLNYILDTLSIEFYYYKCKIFAILHTSQPYPRHVFLIHREMLSVDTQYTKCFTFGDLRPNEE